MATLRDIRRRIKGVHNTQQITKAMKLIAAVKLRKAQKNVINARPYARRISVMMEHLVSDDDRTNSPYIFQREIKNVLIVVVTADRGFCGAFNTNIIKESHKFINEEIIQQNQNALIYCVGKKGFDFYKKTDFQLTGKITGIFNSLHFDIALKINNEIIQDYLDGKFDKVVVIYNEFKSVIQQRIVKEQFLPIPMEKSSDESFDTSNYIFEPGQKEIFNYLLPKHLNAQMWRILLESNAAEFSARMTAMDNATTNATELIKSLSLKYNKERQAAITKELLEVVSGANALG
jgi:F-type H+-transporting ATPase subunit gamma